MPTIDRMYFVPEADGVFRVQPFLTHRALKTEILTKHSGLKVKPYVQNGEQTGLAFEVHKGEVWQRMLSFPQSRPDTIESSQSRNCLAAHILKHSGGIPCTNLTSANVLARGQDILSYLYCLITHEKTPFQRMLDAAHRIDYRDRLVDRRSRNGFFYTHHLMSAEILTVYANLNVRTETNGFSFDHRGRTYRVFNLVSTQQDADEDLKARETLAFRMLRNLNLHPLPPQVPIDPDTPENDCPLSAVYDQITGLQARAVHQKNKAAYTQHHFRQAMKGITQ